MRNLELLSQRKTNIKYIGNITIPDANINLKNAKYA